MLTFQTIVSLSDTGLRSKFMPIIGLNWAVCEDCEKATLRALFGPKKPLSATLCR